MIDFLDYDLMVLACWLIEDEEMRGEGKWEVLGNAIMDAKK